MPPPPRRAAVLVPLDHGLASSRLPAAPRLGGARPRPVDGARFDRYVRYLHAQVEELLTKYGDIGVMWFDGEWESTWTHELGDALSRRCRALRRT